MTVADVAGTIGYLMVGAAGMLTAWILFTKPWRAQLPDEPDDDTDADEDEVEEPGVDDE